MISSKVSLEPVRARQAPSRSPTKGTDMSRESPKESEEEEFWVFSGRTAAFDASLKYFLIILNFFFQIFKQLPDITATNKSTTYFIFDVYASRGFNKLTKIWGSNSNLKADADKN